MTIARAQMNRQLYQIGGMGMESLSPMQPAMQPAMESAMYNPLESNYYSGTPMMMASGGIANLVKREKYGIGSKLKKFVRNIIPNEIAEIAVKAAPFVAPFNPLLAAGMAGIGGFDQTGRIGSSLKSAALTYGAGQIARGIGGAGFQEGFNPFAQADFSGGFTSGIGSLFSSPMGTQPFGTFQSNTPTQNLIQTSPGYTGGADALTYDPTTGQQLGRTAQELQSSTISGGGISPYDAPARSAEQLVKTYGTPPGTEPGYIDLIKKAGSFENVPLSERFNAVKDLSSKALTDLFTKPIPGQPGKTQLDKTALYATFAGASSYYEAKQLAKKAGIPESEFNEADYQRLKVDPEKAKYKDVLKDEAFGIRKAEGGRIGYGLGDLVRSSGIAQTVSSSESGGGSSSGFGGMIAKLIQQNPQLFRAAQESPSRAKLYQVRATDFVDENEDGIDDRQQAAGGGLMNEGVLSIKLTPAQAMAMGGRMGYQEGTKPGFTSQPTPSLVEDFYKSSFYDPKAMGTMALVPVTLPTGEEFTFRGGADSAGFEKYVKSLGYSTNRGDGSGYNVITPTPTVPAPTTPTPITPTPITPTPGLTAPIVETPISVAEQVLKFAKQGTPAVNEEFIIDRRRQAEQDAAARVIPNVTSPSPSIPTPVPIMDDREYANLNPDRQIPYKDNPIYQNFLQSPFYKQGVIGGQVITPVKLSTGEFFNLPDTAVADQFRKYFASTPAGGAPVQGNSQSFSLSNIYKTGGRVKYFMGSEIPVRQNQGGISELDLRAKGGYIPVGIKEKADDVPAMLSRNEFVFTADAVRGAGNGSINKGAQKMYKLMKSLEKKVKKMKKVA